MAEATTITGLLEEIGGRLAADGKVSIETIEAVAGSRFAGPMLFFPAMLVVSPLSLVPTLPTFVAILTIITASQVAWGRSRIWLPGRLRRMALNAERGEKAMRFLKPVARWLDAISRPRLTILTSGLGARLAAVLAILVACTMPPMELVPGASTTAGTVLASLGLSLTTRDGVLLLVALGILVAGGTLIVLLVRHWLPF